MFKAFQRFALLAVAMVAVALAQWFYIDHSQDPHQALVRPNSHGVNGSAPVMSGVGDKSKRTSAPTTSTPQSAEGLTGMIAQEKKLLYEKSQTWATHEAELKRKVSQLSRSELMILGYRTVAEATDPDERTICVYLLSLAGAQAREALNYVVKAKMPDVSHIKDAHAATAKSSQEVSLRLSALEALDVLSMRNPQEIRQDLTNILLVQNENSIKSFVQISLMGIHQGKPGKLSRWLSQLTATSQESL